MALADLKLPPIKWTPAKAADFTPGRSDPVRAFVNHRMVGALPGTDVTFQAGDANRAVSTNFGIGFINGVLEIHQYVYLDDTAYGNGNYDPSGNWDNWGFKTTEINAQTISIEHQDNGQLAASTGKKGIVPPEVQRASQQLQALLRFGTIADWKAAGIRIRDWANNAPILYKEIHAIPIDDHHVINHNDIAGKLKPYCWKPWESDKVGFPAATYITNIRLWGYILLHGAPAPAPEPVPVTYTQAQVDAMIAEAVKTATIAATGTIKKLQDKITATTARDAQIASTLEAAATQLKTQ